MGDWQCQHCGWSITGVSNDNQPDSCYLCDEKSPDEKNTNKAVTHYAITRNDFLNQLHGGQKIANRYLCIYQTDLSASEQITLESLTITDTFGDTVTLDNCVIVNPLILNGSTFKADVNLVKTHFVNGLQLDNCILDRSLRGEGITVEKQIDLSGATIAGDVSLRDATLGILSVTATHVQGDLDLSGSTFLEDFSGNSLVVSGNALFERCHFKNEFYLSDASITQDLSFLDAIFEDEAIFVMVSPANYTLPDPNHKSSSAFDETPTNLQGGVELQRARFLKGVQFEDCNFIGWVDAQGVQCKKRFVIERCIFECGVDLQETRFEEIEQVSLRGSRFFGYVNLSRMDSAGMLRVSDCGFYETLILRYAKLPAIVWNNLELAGNVLASYMTIQSNLWWSDCIFLRDVDLQGGFFEGEVEFREDKIEGDLNLSDAHFVGRFDLASTQIQGYLYLHNTVANVMLITRQQVQRKLASEMCFPRNFERAKHEWEFLMRRFDQRSNYDDLDFAWFKSRQMQRAHAMRKNPLGFVLRSFELILVEWGTGYGMRPWNVIGMALVIILIFGVIYAATPATVKIDGQSYYNGFVLDGREFDRAYQERMRIASLNTPAPDAVCDNGVEFEGTVCIPDLQVWDHVYFSFGTFTGLDFGDIHPSHHGWLKYVAAAESFLGIFILALFASILTRKLIRQ